MSHTDDDLEAQRMMEKLELEVEAETEDGGPALGNDESDDEEDNVSFSSACSFSEGTDSTSVSETLEKEGPRKRRHDIPHTTQTSLPGLWAIVKSCVGKDLTRITLPVEFNEPLSALQRIAEPLQYHACLDHAAGEPSSLRRLAHVAAFAVANTSGGSVKQRKFKPFNPLLGETFEYVDSAIGVRCLVEQVSHHPPISALYCESAQKWRFYNEYSIETKFRGNLKIFARGAIGVHLDGHGELYTWNRPQSTIHNIVGLGQMWTAHDGEMNVVSHTTKERCVVRWNHNAKDHFHLTGKVYDANNQVHFTLFGAWNSGLCLLPGDIALSALPRVDDALKGSKSEVLWRIIDPVPHSEKVFGFGPFALQLNELFPDMAALLCPTDSRLRPDLRAYENVDLPLAASEKHRLEEKQRKARKILEETKEKYHPRWFKKFHDDEFGADRFHYLGGYWDAKAKNEFQNKGAFADIY